MYRFNAEDPGQYYRRCDTTVGVIHTVTHMKALVDALASDFVRAACPRVNSHAESQLMCALWVQSTSVREYCVQ